MSDKLDTPGQRIFLRTKDNVIHYLPNAVALEYVDGKFVPTTIVGGQDIVFCSLDGTFLWGKAVLDWPLK